MEIFLDWNLEERLQQIKTKKRKECVIRLGGSLSDEKEIIRLLRILFNWFEKEKIKIVKFEKIKFTLFIWNSLSEFIKKSDLDELFFNESFLFNDGDFVKRKFYSVIGRNLHEKLFESKLTKIFFLGEKFLDYEYINFCISLENNYRINEIIINSSCPRKEQANIIHKFLLRNRRGYENVKKGVYTILCIKKYTKNNLISNQPKEIVKMICQSVLETFGEKEWCY